MRNTLEIVLYITSYCQDVPVRLMERKIVKSIYGVSRIDGFLLVEMEIYADRANDMMDFISSVPVAFSKDFPVDAMQTNESVYIRYDFHIGDFVFSSSGEVVPKTWKPKDTKVDINEFR